jgi:hypothetical protein
MKEFWVWVKFGKSHLNFRIIEAFAEKKCGMEGGGIPFCKGQSIL